MHRFTKVTLAILAVAGLTAAVAAEQFNSPVVRCQRHADLCLYNTTESMPLGWYRAYRPGTIERGQSVFFCLHGAALAEALRLSAVRKTGGPCDKGFEPLLKIVVALGGDEVVETERGVTVNGFMLSNSVPQVRSLKGVPVRLVAYGRHRLKPDDVWLAALHPRSYDSRYYGPVPVASILYRAERVEEAR